MSRVGGPFVSIINAPASRSGRKSLSTFRGSEVRLVVGGVMRIALVAMSGVRAHNPELTALGLSLPGFVERGKTIASLPSLGLLTLAALTDDRHDVDYYEVDDIAEMDPLPECDVVAFSTYTA